MVVIIFTFNIVPPSCQNWWENFHVFFYNHYKINLLINNQQEDHQWKHFCLWTTNKTMSKILQSPHTLAS